MASKRIYDDDILVSSSDDEKKEGTSAESKRKFTGSFQYKVVFKDLGKQITLSKLFLTISIYFTAFHVEEIFLTIIKVLKMSKIIMGRTLTR